MLLSAVRPMTATDWPEVAEIYRHGIEEGEATFETTVPEWSAFDTGKLAAPRLVAVAGSGAVLGWAAASPVSTRAVYRGVVEHSLYIHRDARGSGAGRALLTAFIEAAEEAGIWTIQASVFPENGASMRLHERAGFRVIGRRERIARSGLGAHAGQWRDTILIERRSERNGRDGHLQ
jgi:L-amino acid N-acyltransferase YncA